ncbi:MAG: retroviral-like aspartic protease family protein [Acidiferrobacterales bacterium]|nr:retroviral-like aspartic protease family protein [Acidiferrobacterales bacterium]
MKHKIIFKLLVTTLFLAGVFGLYSIIEIQSPTLPLSSESLEDDNSTANGSIESDQNIYNSENSSNTEITSGFAAENSNDDKIFEIARLLEKEQYISAVELLDAEYQRLSSQELLELEKIFLNKATQFKRASESSSAIALLTHYSDTFNSLQGWGLLANIQIDEKNWQAANQALNRAIAIEYRPDQLDTLMTKLVSVASHQRALMERQNDELGINQLYADLYASHPSYARFQLELALSNLRLKDTTSARNLLEPLRYDSEFSAIASTALSNLENDASTAFAKPKQQEIVNQRSEIVIPLLRSGNSFFANTEINNRQTTLLLDTGASITALSKEMINSLNLKPIGRTIQLNTANGVTQAKLYRADRISLGRLTIRNLTVAEIDLASNSQIHGLLGTDLLNQLNSNYSYLIDNQRNALIFQEKK